MGYNFKTLRKVKLRSSNDKGASQLMTGEIQADTQQTRAEADYEGTNSFYVSNQV